MKALICVLSLLATVAWAQGFDFTTVEPDIIAEHENSGFGGYGFGSSKDYVRAERAADGHILDKDYAGWLWYDGEIEGCDLESGYEFNGQGQLASGLWLITNNQTCFGRLQDLLSRTYGSDLEMVINRGVVVVEMWIPHTKIVHRMDDNGHSISFYDTSDRTRIGGN